MLKRLHYPLGVLLTCVRWYVAYPLSLRQIEETMHERGVFVDPTTIHRWSIKFLPVLTAAFRRRKRPAGGSWRMDETYVRVGGQWKYLYRAVDRTGAAVDFLLRGKRDLAAARLFLERAIGLHGLPDKITIDKRGANTAAVHAVQDESGAPIKLRQVKYRGAGSPGHQAHLQPMLGFQTFRCARIPLAGMETAHMVKKGNLAAPSVKLHPPQTGSIRWPPERPPLRAFTRADFLIATEPVMATPNSSRLQPKRAMNPATLFT